MAHKYLITDKDSGEAQAVLEAATPTRAMADFAAQRFDVERVNGRAAEALSRQLAAASTADEQPEAETTAEPPPSLSPPPRRAKAE